MSTHQIRKILMLLQYTVISVKDFHPLLFKGYKEILLSDFIRLYQAIDQADIPVKLDIYEGMPHDFQIFLHNTTESNTSLSKMSNFLHQYLGY